MNLNWIKTHYLFLLIFLSSHYAAALVAPEIKWKTFSTEHFQLIYDANHQMLAEAYAVDAERAYYFLAPIFNNETPEKTILVLDDSTDSANGFATPLPRPLINVYPVLPDSLDFLSHYSIWSREMITHEYTHILNFEPTHGFWKPFRYIFGGVFRPNALLPRWYLEGLAVQTESAFTDFGRLRSPLYKAIIRAQVIDGTWGSENLGRANETTIPTWPLGSRPYFYGALVWNDIVREHGSEAIGKLNDRYSRRFPYFLNAPAEDITGHEFPTLMTNMYAYQKNIASKQIADLSQASLTDRVVLFPKISSHLQHSPRISPNNENLIFVNRTVETKDQIYLLNRKASEHFEQSEPQLVASNLDGVSRVNWFPDSKSFVFSALDEFDRYYNFSDLYLYEIETKKKTQVTKGLRARDPVVDKNGERIVFIQNLTSATRLVSVNKNGEDLKILYEPKLQVRISNPEFLEEQKIIFSERDLDGQEYLRELDLTTLQVTTRLGGYEPITSAHMTPQGLVFLSSKTGVANLYLADKNLKSAQPITNTATHIFNGTIDVTTNQVLASRLNSDGGHLETYIFKPFTIPLAEARPTEGYDWKKHEEPTPYVMNASIEEYSASKYLFPQYWLPVIFAGPYGSAAGAVISGQDPLVKHSYVAEGTWDSAINRPGYGFSYLNAQTRVLLGLSLYDQTFAVGSTEQQSTSAMTNREVWTNVTGSFYLPNLSSDWRGFLGWAYFSNQYEGEAATIQQGPTTGFKYSNLSQRGYQISPKGQTLGASYTHVLANNGNVAYGRTSAEGSYYWTKWLPKHHVLKSQVRGTYSDQNRSIFSGTTTAGGDYLSSAINAPYVVRGYPLAEFVGWSVATASLEYRFPISYIYDGPDITPLFSKRLHGAFFWDTLTTQGAYYGSDKKGLRATDLGTFFSGYGAELRYDFTLFYFAPITMRIGYHYGEKTSANGGGALYVGFMVPEF